MVDYSGVVTEDFLTKVTCAFCNDKAKDFINTGDLTNEILDEFNIPKYQRSALYNTAMPLCNKHFYKFITHPQIKNMIAGSRVS